MTGDFNKSQGRLRDTLAAGLSKAHIQLKETTNNCLVYTTPKRNVCRR